MTGLESGFSTQFLFALISILKTYVICSASLPDMPVATHVYV